MAETLTWGISLLKEKKGEEEEGGGGSVEEVAGEGRKGEGEEVNLEREKTFFLLLYYKKIRANVIRYLVGRKVGGGGGWTGGEVVG